MLVCVCVCVGVGLCVCVGVGLCVCVSVGLCVCVCGRERSVLSGRRQEGEETQGEERGGHLKRSPAETDVCVRLGVRSSQCVFVPGVCVVCSRRVTTLHVCRSKVALKVSNRAAGLSLRARACLCGDKRSAADYAFLRRLVTFSFIRFRVVFYVHVETFFILPFLPNPFTQTKIECDLINLITRVQKVAVDFLLQPHTLPYCKLNG